LIPSEKCLELGTRKAKKLAILKARPSSALNSLDFVAGKLLRKAAREGFVKQDAHPAQ
jgi:hypothetical protein